MRWDNVRYNDNFNIIMTVWAHQRYNNIQYDSLSGRSPSLSLVLIRVLWLFLLLHVGLSFFLCGLQCLLLFCSRVQCLRDVCSGWELFLDGGRESRIERTRAVLQTPANVNILKLPACVCVCVRIIIGIIMWLWWLWDDIMRWHVLNRVHRKDNHYYGTCHCVYVTDTNNYY